LRAAHRLAARTPLSDSRETQIHHLRRALRMAGVGYWVWDLARDTIDWSDEIWSIVGRERSGNKLDAEAFLALVHPEDRARVRDVLGHAAASGETPDLRYRIVRPDGHIVFVLARARLLRDDSDTPVSMLGTLQDITELTEQQRAAERANRVKTDFLSRMSHELRTPLNAVLGFSQLLTLDEDELLPRHKEHVHEIYEGGVQLLQLVNRLLDLSSIETGAMAFRLEFMDVADVVRDAVRLIRPIADRRGIEISETPGTEPSIVNVDKARLRQVLVNLVSNAVRFNRQGGRVNIDVMQSENAVRVTVTDTGYGIPASQQPYLFRALEDGMPSPYRAEGPGIGLTICKHIIEEFGGTIEYETAEGQGTIFRFDLRLARTAPVQ
jgi:PAS domain S-box-containing protein